MHMFYLKLLTKSLFQYIIFKPYGKLRINLED